MSNALKNAPQHKMQEYQGIVCWTFEHFFARIIRNALAEAVQAHYREEVLRIQHEILYGKPGAPEPLGLMGSSPLDKLHGTTGKAPGWKRGKRPKQKARKR